MKKRLGFLLTLLFAAACAQTETRNIETPQAEPPPQAQQPQKITGERALKLIKTKDAVAPFFQPMGAPEEHDWLAAFQESGQTFEEYLGENPTLPTAERKKIYIQPAGHFSATERKVLRLVADYMKAFYNLPVELKPEMKLKDVPPEMERKNPYEGQRQIRTHYFIGELLPKLLPADAAAFICLTNIDLYPDENWNYVFGQASLETRVGVWSLYRFGKPDKSETDYKKFLARALKIAMHETGHMFTMRHCAKYECLMSGTNHLGETDRRPLDACPECTAKIAWAMNYEPAERSRNLAAFWEKQNWIEERESFLKKAEAFTEAAKQ
ncbi:MAG TPA: archaemetzincin [Pyrinomonadaceae bacterium]|nr:archaemetzincin [Pyrinomonadaceae bacterium]